MKMTPSKQKNSIAKQSLQKKGFVKYNFNTTNNIIILFLAGIIQDYTTDENNVLKLFY